MPLVRDPGTDEGRMGLGHMPAFLTQNVPHNSARLIVAVMLAVVVSLSLHHGAMGAGTVHAQAPFHTHLTDAELCGSNCPADPQGISACCGIGLCLSALPVAPQQGMTLPPSSTLASLLKNGVEQIVAGRIDRPPKVLDSPTV